MWKPRTKDADLFHSSSWAKDEVQLPHQVVNAKWNTLKHNTSSLLQAKLSQNYSTLTQVQSRTKESKTDSTRSGYLLVKTNKNEETPSRHFFNTITRENYT